jgi:hypothetical protein
MPEHEIEVVVRGPLWPALMSALDGYSVHTAADGLTTISGRVVDQPQLLGLIEMLGNMNVEVIGVNRTDATAP